ncbi:MAG: tail fiber domain-containing protein, partial [Bacteroides sp.]|nr:tail fiber domain-containing protein [Bacteroides sp.]
AAASAPMVNKKMVRSTNEKSPWIIVDGSESIAYNQDNRNVIQDRKTASIGATLAPNREHPRLYINTSGDANPHIMFGRNNGSLMRLIAGGENANTWLSNISPNNANASVAMGWNSNASANRSVAVGMDSEANSPGAVSVGNRARSRAQVSIAIGDGAQAGFAGGNDANKFSAIAIGSEAIANRVRSIAIGRHAEATASRAIAMGSSGDDGQTNRARAMGAGSIAIGASALANQQDSVSLGSTAQTTGNGSISIGVGSIAGDDQNRTVNFEQEANKIAIGTNSHARKENSIAIGTGAEANPNSFGTYESVKKRAIAIGWEARALDSDAIVLGNRFAGRRSTANNIGAIAIGSPAQATGRFSIAIGGSTNTTATVTGNVNVPTTIASGESSVAIGSEATATGANSVAIGRGATAESANTIVLGDANSVVRIPGRLVVDGQAILGYDNGKWQSDWDHVAVIRARRGCRLEVLERDGDGDWDACYVDGKYGISWARVTWADNFKSDRRLKNVGKTFNSGLDKIKKLEVFNYTFKEDESQTPRVGVMAQDLQKVFPNAVFKGEDGFLRIRMEDMFYAVINAVKELDSRLSVLEQKQKKIDELEKRVEKLEKRLEALEK